MAQVIYVENENYGYAVASYDQFAAVGNPALLRYTDPTGSLETGSVDIYKYNNVTDLHDLKWTSNRPLTPEEIVYINTEDQNLTWGNLHYSFWEQLTESLWETFDADNMDLLLKTEDSGNVSFTANKELIIDAGNYISSSEDDFGHALDMNGFALAVGSRYFKTEFEIGTHSYTITGSDYVYLYDLDRLNLTPYDTYQESVLVTTDVVGSDFVNNVWLPEGHKFSQVILQGSGSVFGTFGSGWKTVSIVDVTTDVFGHDNYLKIAVPASIYVNYTLWRTVGVRGGDPFTSYIKGPPSGSITSSTIITQSFGYSVSMNDEWLAVGDPEQYDRQGAAHLYRKYKGIYGSAASWSYYQTVTASDAAPGDLFGHSLALNKSTGSHSASLVVGTQRTGSANVYYFEYSGSSANSGSPIISLPTGSWQEKYLFEPNYTSQSLTFLPDVYPVMSASQGNDGYGYSVDIYGNTVIVGAPSDRIIYEYSGSPAFKQGAAYIYEKCPSGPLRFELKLKSIGDEKILKNNKLGFSVGVWDEYAAAGSPNINVDSMSLCFIRGTLFQEHFGTTEEEEIENQGKFNGQFALFEKNTSSLDWSLLNIYQTKKRLREPYRSFGYDVSVSDDFIIVGAPLSLSGSYRRMDMGNTGSYTWNGDPDELGDINGKAFIYNLNNLREEFYVGNVFYRNGKLVIMTSGSSALAGILFNTVSTNEYSYELDFKSSNTLYEKQIICSVDPGEFNVSTNPTSLIQNTSSLDMNNNGEFDFQDVDILLRFLKYRNTADSGTPNVSFDWSSSILVTDDEISYYNSQYSSSEGYDRQTVQIYSQSFATMNGSYYEVLDINDDNLADDKDMNMIWKYFSNRLNQSNYEDYLTPNSERQTYQELLEYMDGLSKRNDKPQILTEFFDYSTNIKTDPTGSYLTPMVTTIGLYSGTDLVAVAKLGAPIKLAPDFPINFIVKMDF